MKLRGNIFFLLKSIKSDYEILNKIHKKIIEHNSLSYDSFNIVSFDFMPNFDNIVKCNNHYHVEQDILSRVNYLNFYNDIRPEKKATNKKLNELLNEIEGLNVKKYIDEKSKTLAYRFYENGLYINYIKYDENDKIKLIDFIAEDRSKTKRYEFDMQGNLVRIRHYNSLGELSLDRYMDNEENCYLSTWVKNGKVTRVQYHEETMEYSTLNILKSNWLKRIISNHENPIIVTPNNNTHNILMDVNYIPIIQNIESL
ncbi:hypothetical protein [Bacillus sp. C28GYM-DRY-1]|uniref:hypothetical protein n=1 Tax=Bacillus sp. C28GYM-DRY-1 TaxID=3062686 RepID=UPI0026749AC1|nr:hypothetical protein [Bacillus sp. C28GYM-DRY-1]MDO3659853.1 hypothetical protein [Bacillus sp. C28GYM-DRY-1]